MPRCPVCEVRYVQGKTEICPVCGWNVQSLTLLTGLIPEVAEKEATRLQWAKALWNNLQSQREKFHQLQMQLKASGAQNQQIQDQLQQTTQENTSLTERLRQQDITLAHLQADQHPAIEQLPQEEPELEESALEPAAAASDVAGFTPSTSEGEPLETAPVADHQDLLLQPTPQVLEPVYASFRPDSSLETVNMQALMFPSIKPPEPTKAPEQKVAVQKVATISALPLSQIAAQELIQEFVFDVVTLQVQGLDRQQHKAFCFHEFLEADITLEMVLVPGGTFWMGAPDAEDERDSSESPQHEVTIAPFCLSRFPITQKQWRSIAALPKIKRSLSPYPSNFENDDHPVEQVSWYDAVEFCTRLSQKTGRHYRLPSEAEWEYACRAGTTTPFHFGETLLPELANYDGNYTYGEGHQGLYHQETTAIGLFQTANAFGLSDMHGNVWEWCADPWHDNYQNAPTDGSIWQSDEGGTYQVLRGGAWYCLPGLCRSAQRHWNQPDGIGSGIGFRVACQLP